MGRVAMTKHIHPHLYSIACKYFEFKEQHLEQRHEMTTMRIHMQVSMVKGYSRSTSE